MISFYPIDEHQEINIAHVVRLLQDDQGGTNICLTGGTVVNVGVPMAVVKKRLSEFGTTQVRDLYAHGPATRW